MKDTSKIIEIDLLKVWKKNPRSIDKKNFERLKKQIKKLGQYKPLIANQDNIVVGGNMRLRALQELGEKQVWVNFVKTTSEAEMLEFALSDNDNAGQYDELELAQLVSLTPPSMPDIFGVSLGKQVPLEKLPSLSQDGDEQKPPEDKPGFIQMVFTLTQAQADSVAEALKRAKDNNEFTDTGNDNLNGNALAHIIEVYNDNGGM